MLITTCPTAGSARVCPLSSRACALRLLLLLLFVFVGQSNTVLPLCTALLKWDTKPFARHVVEDNDDYDCCVKMCVFRSSYQLLSLCNGHRRRCYQIKRKCTSLTSSVILPSTNWKSMCECIVCMHASPRLPIYCCVIAVRRQRTLWNLKIYCLMRENNKQSPLTPPHNLRDP